MAIHIALNKYLSISKDKLTIVSSLLYTPKAQSRGSGSRLLIRCIDWPRRRSRQCFGTARLRPLPEASAPFDYGNSAIFSKQYLRKSKPQLS